MICTSIYCHLLELYKLTKPKSSNSTWTTPKHVIPHSKIFLGHFIDVSIIFFLNAHTPALQSNSDLCLNNVYLLLEDDGRLQARANVLKQAAGCCVEAVFPAGHYVRVQQLRNTQKQT